MSRPATDYTQRMLFEKPRLVGGVKMCRWTPCTKALQGRQVKWCSSDCAGAAYATWNWASARWAVFQRDQGICSACGLDCEHLKKLLWWVEWKAPGNGYARRANIREACRLLGLPVNYSGGDDCWEADHIVALVEGGALCDLSNLRTLCHWCHKVETRALAGRRARSRKVTADFLALVLGR